MKLMVDKGELRLAVNRAIDSIEGEWIDKPQPATSDSISRQAAIAHAISGLTREIDGENWIRVSEVRESIKAVPSAQPEIVRCKDCNKAQKCYGNVVMRSRGGGYIYCPLEFCSEAERKTDG